MNPPTSPPVPPRTNPQSIQFDASSSGAPLANLGVGLLVESLLKRPEDLHAEAKGTRLSAVTVRLFVLGLVCYFLYGLLVGSFSGGMQWWASPLKIAGGMAFSAVLCLPSLYIFGCLSRSDVALKQCLALLGGLLALSGLLLIGFLPVAWVFSSSIELTGFMGFLHLVFWAVGMLFGLRFLRDGMCALKAETLSPVYLWMIIFTVVCLQMTATLRPLLGPGDSFFSEGKRFILTHWTSGLSDPTHRW